MVRGSPGHVRRGQVRGRLNLFQAQMLRWRELHPYNAVHAVALTPAADTAHVERAIAAELEHCGLTGLTLDRRRRRFEWRGGRASVRLEVTRGAHALPLLERAIERELNAPFADAMPLEPFRFFLVEADDARVLGLAYDHFIAGGDCILSLLAAMVERIGGREPDHRPNLYPPTQARLFLRNLPRVTRGLARLPALVQSARRTARPRYRDVSDGYEGYALYTLAPAHAARLLALSKAWSVTVNDMFLALLLLALDPLAPKRHAAAQRRELAVASIMNLRAELGDPGRDAFGQYLGSLRVTHAVPPGATLEDVARDVNRQTTAVKEGKLFLQTLLAMRYVAAVWRLLKPAQRAGFYAKSYPIWAGVSSLNVNAMWPRPPGTAAPLYIRGVPTGPLAPLVLATTTVGDTIYAGVSYRTAALDRAAVDQLWAGLVHRLDAR